MNDASAHGGANAPAPAEGAAASQATTALPPAAGFHLVRYFMLASLPAILLAAAALTYFEHTEGDFFKLMQREQNAFFARAQENFARQQGEAARRDLLSVHEAGNVNLTRLFVNTLWEKDFAPFVAKAQRIPIDHCRAIPDGKDAGGKPVQSGEKKACYAGIGERIMALPEFQALNARVFEMMQKSTVFKIKVYDLRGITAYSSEHSQIGEDKLGNVGWQSAMAGDPASELTHRGKFGAFEGVVEERDLIESYIPVLAPGGEKIVGVFEVYSDVTPFIRQIDATLAQISKRNADNQAQLERVAAANQAMVDESGNLRLAAVLVPLVLLYLVLFLVVRNGQRIIDTQGGERRRAEESRAWLAAIVENATVAIFTRALDGTILTWNPGAEKMLGYTAAEAIGKPIAFTLPRGRPANLARNNESLLRGEVVARESDRITKDGRVIDVLTSHSPIRDPAGNITGASVILQDITELKRAEVRLRLQGAALDAAANVIVITDRKGTIRWVNRAFSAVTGYSFKEAIGQNPRLLKSGRHGPEFYRRMFDTILGGSVWQGEIVNRYKDGRLGWEEMTITPMRGDGGEITNFIAIKQDINARKESEMQRGRLSAILEASPDFVATADPQGKVLYYNSAARRLLELPEDTDPSQVRIADTHPRWAADLILDTGIPGAVRDGVWTGETALLSRSGREIPVIQVILAHKGPDGSVEFLSTIARDITERKNQERGIDRLNRTLSVLSEINSAIVRIRDRRQLLEEACRIAVEHGNFGMAWISEFDPVTLDVTQVAYGGSDDMGRFGSLKTTARADVPLGQGVVGRAIRTGEPVFVNDLAAEPDVGSARRQEAIRRGYRSAIALPLIVHGAIFGTLSLYAKEPAVFDERELKLLRELASDISFALEFIEQQQRVARLSRIQAVLSGINSAIVRIRHRGELLREACRIAVEHGNFGIAWIGMLDVAAQDVTPVAWAGLGASEYLGGIKSTIRDDLPQGRGVLAQAIMTRRPAYNNDITIDPEAGSKRRAEAIRRGYRSVVVLPLIVEGEVSGSMSLFARELNFFDEGEMKLLAELAGDVSFALDHIAKAEKLEKLARIRAVSSGINAAIVRIRERQALFDETCRIASEQGKFEMVWIGTVDGAKQEVQPAAWAGFSSEAAHAVTWAAIDSAQGTMSEAIRTRKPSIRNDIEKQYSTGRLRQEALARGSRSNASLPLVVDDRVVALVSLFASGVGFFDEDELALLEELASDVSFALDHIAKEERLDYLAYYDALTGLPNRRLFVDRVGQQMRARSGEPRMVALILLDIERLRNINETLGRHGGDELLRLVARRLEHAFNGPDYIARISADSFGAVIRGVRDAVEIAHAIEGQLLACFSEPFLLNDKELRVAAKIGIAMFPTDGPDADTLFKNAEAALRRAKESGERFLFYTAEMNAQAAHSLSLETRLRKAVETRQFVLHYQPKVELAGGRVCGLEALIRWQDPAAGLVAPGTFIPLLEETGLILEVGRWALAQALADYREWTARGRSVPRIAVNVSAIQLQQKDFVDTVVAVVRQAGGIPQALELEITESLLMKDIGASIHKLSALRVLGIHVAMDDFGTGYSSLSYLARLPIDLLKIDRSFINGMTVDGDGTAIVSTIITLAHSLNLRVVAEGVETEAQAKLLRLLKCDEMQGYLFSRPLPAAEVEAKYLAATVA